MVLEGEYGQYGLSMSVPIALGRRGAVKIVEWELASDEKVELTRSAAVLAAAARLVDENLQY